MSEPKVEGLALLRIPFPAHQISNLPKPKSKDAPKGKCSECGGWHGLPAVHLDYVGHAALTDRLLDADPRWTWEPFAVDERGLPALDGFGGMWIRLTVCGVSRIGYGHAGDKQGGDAIKEIIGDALRNSGMRFGAALDLWHKGELHKDEEDSLVPALKASIAAVQARREEDPIEMARYLGLTVERAKVVRKAAGEAVARYNINDEWGCYEAVSWLEGAEREAAWKALSEHSDVRACVKRMQAQEAAGDKPARAKVERVQTMPGLKKTGVTHSGETA